MISHTKSTYFLKNSHKEEIPDVQPMLYIGVRRVMDEYIYYMKPYSTAYDTNPVDFLVTHISD